MAISQQPPKTPPQRTRQSALMITPRTPRYAPIDEPDTYPVSPTLKRDSRKRITTIHGKDGKLIQSPASSMSLLTLPTRPSTTKTVLPMTPDQTPVIRKQVTSTTASAKSSTTTNTSASRGQTGANVQKNLKGTRLFTNPPASTSASASSSKSEKATTKSVADLKRKLASVRPSPVKKRKLQVFHDSLPSAPPVFSPARPSKRPHHRTVLDGDDDLDTSKPIASSSSSLASSSTVKQKHPYDSSINHDLPGMWHIFRGKKIFRPFATGSDPFKNYVPRVLFGPRKDTIAASTTTTSIASSTGIDEPLKGMSTPIPQKSRSNKRKNSLDLSLSPVRPGKKREIPIGEWSDSDDDWNEVAAIIESAKKNRRISDPFVSAPIQPHSTEPVAAAKSVRDIEDEEAETEHETEIPSSIQARTTSFRKGFSDKPLFTAPPTKPRKQQPGSKKQFFR